MDERKSNASASGEKKGPNFFSKTAQSIRQKVQGLTNSNGSKKDKQEKKQKKKNDKKSKTSTPSNAANKADSGLDSDDEIGTTKSESSPPTERNRVALRANKSDIQVLDTSTAASANSKILSDKQFSKDSAIKSSDDQQDATASPSSSPPNSSSVSPPTETLKDDLTPMEKRQILFSFAGITTVDDLRDRIDEAIETGDTTTHIQNERTPTKLTHLGKSGDNDEDDDEDEDDEDDEEEDDDIEPIRINYNDLHSIDDLLLKINRQPGNRKIMLVNAPNKSAAIVLQQSSTSPLNIPSKSDPSEDLSSAPKSLLKTSQNPSALDTSTKTASFQDEQIHVNIESAQTMNSTDDSDELSTQISPPKRTAPIAPSLASEQSSNPDRIYSKSSLPPSKQFTISKAQAIDKHDEDHGISVITQAAQKPTPPSISSVATEEKLEENETSDWL